MRDILLDHNATGHMELLHQVVFSQISARVIPTHLNRSYSMSAAPKNHELTDPTHRQLWDGSLLHVTISLSVHPAWTSMDS